MQFKVRSNVNLEQAVVHTTNIVLPTPPNASQLPVRTLQDLLRVTRVGKKDRRNLMAAPRKHQHVQAWPLKSRNVTALVTYVMALVPQPEASISYWHFQAL